MRPRPSSLLLIALAVTLNGAFAQVQVGGQSMLAAKGIIDNALNSADHTTLVAAVKAAGLVDTLKGAGPFTVFAPTNAAFGKLPAGSGGKLKFSLNGMHNIRVMDDSGNAANVSTYDVYQSNGVINVIDSVLMPN